MNLDPLAVDSISRAIAEEGCVVIPGVLSPEFVVRARRELEVAIEREAEYHGGTGYKDYGMVLPGEPTVALAKQIAKTSGLAFKGLQTWEGHTLTVTDPAEKRRAIWSIGPQP